MTAAGKKAAEGVGEYKMNIELIEKTPEKITFMLKDVTTAFANALRRSAVDEVPVMAVEDVEFSKNNSILYDEMIAHRLGLIPLTTDLKSYNLPEKCTCKGAGCAKCQLKASLKARSAGIVLSKDLKTKDPKVKPVFPDMPVVKLLKGQDLELTAIATLGKGKIHAKWSPGICTYRYKPEITIKKDPENPEEVAQSCPLGIFEVKNDKLAVNKDKALTCHSCDACVEASNKAVEVISDPAHLIFTIESWGQLAPKEIMLRAADELNEKADEFIEKIKESK
ncbi:DNA-directed RNA polymerase subunit D [Candidatus Woesearchaeota archaeon]|nr:DNA-directed RNA polymerase subunit D [Candidatus Woesearchaeota archaeon]